ncbi:i[[h]] channel isoform e [Holotrichia oblita]|uniref:I[[h]] channel isoform e n=1 Tax=Holotrichia oblita TaxID=644536 RepID=A0ACB9TUP8_HOLOL|nr:i[[h]] channel isoform e [Holotrichia oblita]
MTNDIIIKYATTGDCMYFIANGTVAIYSKAGREIRHLLDGDHFGEIALVTTNKRIAFVVAVEPCELYKLERKDFIHAILPYPDLLVKIERIAFERIEETSNLEGRTD